MEKFSCENIRVPNLERNKHITTNNKHNINNRKSTQQPTKLKQESAT